MGRSTCLMLATPLCALVWTPTATRSRKCVFIRGATCLCRQDTTVLCDYGTHAKELSFTSIREEEGERVIDRISAPLSAMRRA